MRDSVDFDARVRARGEELEAGLLAIANRYPDVFSAPRGLGLMRGLPVRAPYEAKSFIAPARERERLLLNAAGDNTLRFVPPLVIERAELAEALRRLERAIDATLHP